MKARINKINIDGIKFNSKKQADYYQFLKDRQAVGDIKYFLKDVPFNLGGGKRYLCDFMVVWADDSVAFHQIKAYQKAGYIINKQLVEANYSIKIEEV